MKNLELHINRILSKSFVERIEQFDNSGREIDLLRLDSIHPEISGNKLFKLKYNILEMKKSGKKGILTFGGAFSNHIAATAAAGTLFAFETIGIIRGEELSKESNSTLQTAASRGMALTFVSREEYKRRNDPDFLESLQNLYPEFHIVPEGGSNSLGMKGCEEIVGEHTLNYDYVALACGTGTTLMGILKVCGLEQKVCGISVLKGQEFHRNLTLSIYDTVKNRPNFDLISSYHFGGYGRYNQPLIDYTRKLASEHRIFTEPIYTGKLMYGISDLIKNQYFRKSSKILAIHTGGMQGTPDINL